MPQQALYGVLTLVLMAGMGSSLTSEAFRDVLRQPRALLVGMCCQFGWVPLAGWLAVEGLALAPDDAVGLLLIVTVGGGNASNLLTYLARADVALSLAMTGCSALVSVVLTPLLLGLYAAHLPEAAQQVPLGAVSLTVGMMAVPVPLGMWARRARPALAARLDLAGRWAGLALLVLILSTGVVEQLTALGQAPWRVLAACALVSCSGMGVGVLAARMASLSPSQGWTIAFETGVQNLPAALAVIAIAFEPERQAALARAPMLYASIALLAGGAVLGWVRRR